MPPQFENIQCHRIVADPARFFEKVRKHIADNFFKFLIGIVLLLLIQDFIPYFISLFYKTTMADVIANMNPNIPQAYLKQMPYMPIACYFFALLFNGVIDLGKALYCLTYVRNRDVEYRALFEGFRFYLKALGLFVVKTMFIVIGTMLFIVPGVIYALNFSQCFYILADDPDKTIFQCLAESKLRMVGNRMSYIVTLLYFILIAAFMYMLSTFFAGSINADLTTIQGIAMFTIVNIPLYCGLSFLAVGQATYYELLLQGDFSRFRYRGQDAFRDDVSYDQEA